MEKKAVKTNKPAPIKVTPSVVKKVEPVKEVAPKVVAKPIDEPGSLESLKASLNDIPADQRTQEVWASRMKTFISHHGYEAVDQLITSRYFDKWVKG